MNVTRRELFANTAALGAVAALARVSQAAPRRAEPKRILILGGTGFIGPQIVAACKAQGWQLTLFNRGKTHADMFKDDAEVEQLHGDRDGDLKSLEDAVKAGRKWHAVVDDCGYVPRVVKASAELLAPATEQYVFISTCSVYSDTATEHQDESGALATIPDDTPAEQRENVMQWYGALKALCETTVEAAFPKGATLLRPGLIVGPGDSSDRYTYWPARLARGGEVLAPGDGSDPLQYIDARDLGGFVAQVIADRTLGVFNVFGPKPPLLTRDFLAACDKAAAATVKDRPKTSLTWVPTDFLEAQNVSAWQDLPLWLPHSGETAGFHTMKNDKAVAKGLTFRDPQLTAADTLKWWLAQPDDRRAKPRAGLTAERETAALAAWHAKEKEPATPAAPAGKSGG